MKYAAYNHSVSTTRFYNEVLQWLQENVGNLLWSHPIVEWHGEGWHVRSTPHVSARSKSAALRYTVTFEDPEKALMFGLWV